MRVKALLSVGWVVPFFLGCGEPEQPPTGATFSAKGEDFGAFRQKGDMTTLAAEVDGHCPARCDHEGVVGLHGDVESFAMLLAALAGHAEFPSDVFADAAGYELDVADGTQVIVDVTDVDGGRVMLVTATLDYIGIPATLGPGQHELWVIPTSVKNWRGYEVKYRIMARVAR